MARFRLRWALVAVVLLPACADRSAGDANSGDTAEDGSGTGDTGPVETDCGVDPPTCTDQVLSGDCSDAISMTEADCGPDDMWVCPEGFHFEDEVDCSWPGYCDGVPPTCTNQPKTGECVDGGWEESGVCNARGQWECPDGFHPIDEVHCENPTCDGEAPTCYAAGDCDGATETAVCVYISWTCPDGYTTECGIACQPNEMPPDDCYDQGPGECADASLPPSCTDGFWTCPDGWDFGGYGESCEFPGG